MVAVLSEWWLFYLSGGWCRPLPTTVGTSLVLDNALIHHASDMLPYVRNVSYLVYFCHLTVRI